MPANKKIFIGIGLGILLLLVVGFFVAKITIGKILKNPETKKDIEGVIAYGFQGILNNPRATLGTISLQGFSQFTLTNLRIYDGPKVIYTSNRIVLECSIIKQVIVGRCNMTLRVNLNEDGKFSLQMVLPRSVLAGEPGFQNSLKGSGTLTNLNGYKMFSTQLSEKGAQLQIKGGLIDGEYDFSYEGQAGYIPKINFSGQVKKLKLELQLRGKRSHTIPSTPVTLTIDENGLNFVEPVKVQSFGLGLAYQGGVAFGGRLKWNGDFSVSGNAMIAGFFPAVLRCKTRPRNPAKFSIQGPFSDPNCM